MANLVYKDGSKVLIRYGPASGYHWRHYQCYQPWMSLGLYEPDVARLIYKSLCAGDVFFGIGANAGYFTLIAAKAVGATGQVIAFEPVSKNIKTITEQIALNGLEAKCRVEPFAISDCDGKASIVIPERNANAHLADTLAPHIVNQQGAIEEITCITLDNYVAQNAWPTLVKIDIEGAEVKALRGAEKMLSGVDAPTFLITAHSHDLADQVKFLLRQANYEFMDFPHMIHAVPIRSGRSQ